MALTKEQRRQRIKKRIRKNLSGNGERPRLTVFRSNKQIYAQCIDDISGKTLVSASSLEKDVETKKDSSKGDQAKLVGELIAKKCKDQGISEVIFDRNGYLYHGRIKNLADAARKGGLKF